MSAIGSCSAIGNETFSFNAASPTVSTSMNLTPAAASRARAAPATVATSASRPAQNEAGMPMRMPASGAAAIGVAPVMTASSSATSATVRPMGPTVSRVWLIGTTPAPS